MRTLGEGTADKTQGARQMPGHVLVTVGSTKFDQLIQAVDTEAFAAALHERGFDSLLVQVHRSASSSDQPLMPDPEASRALEVQCLTDRDAAIQKPLGKHPHSDAHA